MYVDDQKWNVAFKATSQVHYVKNIVTCVTDI